MAMAVPIMMIASAAISAVSAIKQGQDAKAAADYNATVAKQNADMARQQGAAAAAQQNRAARQQLGRMQASYGASGVDVGQGSPLDVLSDSASQAELDRLTTLYNYEVRATGYQNSAKLDEMQGENAQTSSYLNAAGAVAKGVGSMYSGGMFGGSGGGTAIPNYSGPSAYNTEYY